MVSVPPPFDAMASRALTARLMMTCSSWPGIGADRAEVAAVLDDQLDRLAEQALQQVRHLRDDVGKLQHLRAQRLLAREGEQLAGQAGGAVRVRLDLLDVVIVAVARRVPHQHQVAMADDRGQDVVEIVRDAAGELADRLHLGRLGDLPLELGFLAIVLEQQQHRRIAEPAQAGDGQRDRLLRLAREADGEVARHGRAARVAANGVGDRRLVLLDDEVAGIDRLGIALDARGAAEGLVHRQEAAVAVDQRQADRQHVEQRLEVGRAARCFRAVEQQEGARPARLRRIDRHMHRAQRRRRPRPRRASGTGRLR